MLGCRDPSSSQNGPISQSPSPRRTFSSRITHTMMLWLYLVSSRDFWFTMFWLIQAAHRISYLLRPSDRCKSHRTRFMMLHTLFCGFRGRQIVALGKITMPVTFGFVHNTRNEHVVFDIVDMEYPYNAIIGRGTLNAFEAILHSAYLCMKIPSEQGPIAIHGSHKVARKAEGNWTDSKAIHNIDGAEACEQYKYRREKAAHASM
jgi:hypothetical protein